MKLIIAGSRTLSFSCYGIQGLIYTILGAFPLPLEVVSGGAKGIDESGEEFVKLIKEDTIFLTRFPADWDKHGKAAGPIRNKQMADYADALLLIWDGKSKGSANMKTTMQKLNKPIYEVIIQCHNLK